MHVIVSAWRILWSVGGVCGCGFQSGHVSQEASATPMDTRAMNVSNFTFCGRGERAGNMKGRYGYKYRSIPLLNVGMDIMYNGII